METLENSKAAWHSSILSYRHSSHGETVTSTDLYEQPEEYEYVSKSSIWSSKHETCSYSKGMDSGPSSRPNSRNRSFKQLEHADDSSEGSFSTSDLYKTELCRSFADSKICRYGSKCQFAHGVHELRPITRHRKYKTERCKNYEKDGICPYGPRCRFIHSEQSMESGDNATLRFLPSLSDPIHIASGLSGEPHSIGPIVPSSPDSRTEDFQGITCKENAWSPLSYSLRFVGEPPDETRLPIFQRFSGAK